MVVVVDYKAGNIGSIVNMLRKVGTNARISEGPQDILDADKLILPGVGAFDYGMSRLREANLVEPLNRRVLEDKVPILGICLGAQLMCKASEEGSLPGLGWVNADVKKFSAQVDNVRYPVPHMGWDIVKPNRESRLHQAWPPEARFYFVHSYFISCYEPADVLFANVYGNQFHSAFEKGNILGVQFHPEKSHKFGKQLLKNFIDLY